MPDDPTPSTQLPTDAATFHETGESFKAMDKRESDAREVLARVLNDGGFRNEAADIRNGLDVQMCDGWAVRAMLAFADSRPAADLEAVRETCAKVADCHPVNDPGERPLNKLAEEAVCEHATRIATAIRSLDLSALSGAGEG